MKKQIRNSLLQYLMLKDKRLTSGMVVLMIYIVNNYMDVPEGVTKHDLLCELSGSKVFGCDATIESNLQKLVEYRYLERYEKEVANKFGTPYVYFKVNRDYIGSLKM